MTTARLPEELVRRAKRKAAVEGLSLTALNEEGLRRVVSDRVAEEPRCKLPRVSKETGGVLPVIDLNNSAALQEMDDLEYVRRLK